MCVCVCVCVCACDCVGVCVCVCVTVRCGISEPHVLGQVHVLRVLYISELPAVVEPAVGTCGRFPEQFHYTLQAPQYLLQALNRYPH